MKNATDVENSSALRPEKRQGIEKPGAIARHRVISWNGRSAT
jgi:hypothetical protein